MMLTVRDAVAFRVSRDLGEPAHQTLWEPPRQRQTVEIEITHTLKGWVVKGAAKINGYPVERWLGQTGWVGNASARAVWETPENALTAAEGAGAIMGGGE